MKKQIRLKFSIIAIVLCYPIFALMPASITVGSPNGGENWQKTSTHTVSWSGTGVSGNVIIQLHQGGANQGTIYNGANNGSFSWTINTYLNGKPIIPGSYKLQVKSLDDTSVKDKSNGDFTISAATLVLVEQTQGNTGNLVISSPKSGEEWERGKSYPIRWLRLRVLKKGLKLRQSPKPVAKPSTQRISTMKIELKRVQCPAEIWTAGYDPPWEIIKTSVLDVGVYNWLIPKKRLGCFKIRISENRSKGQTTTSKRFKIIKGKDEPAQVVELEEKK